MQDQLLSRQMVSPTSCSSPEWEACQARPGMRDRRSSDSTCAEWEPLQRKMFPQLLRLQLRPRQPPRQLVNSKANSSLPWCLNAPPRIVDTNRRRINGQNEPPPHWPPDPTPVPRKCRRHLRGKRIGPNIHVCEHGEGYMSDDDDSPEIHVYEHGEGQLRDSKIHACEHGEENSVRKSSKFGGPTEPTS